MAHSWSQGNALIIAAALVAIASVAAVPRERDWVARFVNSLREPSFQTVNVNVASFVGPDATPAVHQMILQMIANQVTTTVSEAPQSAGSVSEASQIAGFPVHLLAQRKDTPELTISGKRAFKALIDRARLQAILREAGRSDLALPQSIDGAAVSVEIPRSIQVRYGTCPRAPSAAANVATPAASSTAYNDCVILSEGPSPQAVAPAGLDLASLAQIGLEAAGMTSLQARQFLQTVNWRSALSVSIPRLRSYAAVKVNRVQATLLNLSSRRGATYRLIWVKDGMVYALTGYGDPLEAVRLADSLT